ncbi:hypothetical protein E6C27_scaffold74G002650 [Cucumis melo var. makuwa]|uniref:Uncharacterized protein n=1 Tax=Cucumis melo var. makuwa TaxID=1194695 RepID=A0A5A7TUP1_CUCMM|nr:hypothetical protein E6C27_scaffold74G002650 [Cucumis melo var. makuwa]
MTSREALSPAVTYFDIFLALRIFIILAREWSSRKSMLFAKLGIRDDLKDETVAILMIADTIYSLAVPVLTNIYYGLEPCKHVTQQFTNWWTTRHGTYFEDNRHHLMSSAIPPPSQPKLPKNRGSNLGGKKIRSVKVMTPTLEEEVKEHKDESDSNKSDRHWKRPLKKAKSPLNNHLEGLIELGSDESLTGPHVVDSAFEEVGTSKTPVNKLAKQSLRPSALLEEIRRGK